MMTLPPSIAEATTVIKTDLDATLPATECPLSHRVARRFFSSVISMMLLSIAASLLYIFVIQR